MLVACDPFKDKKLHRSVMLVACLELIFTCRSYGALLFMLYNYY